MPTTRETFDEAKPLLKPVPHDSKQNVCYLCFGATDGDYRQCSDCWKLFLAPELRTAPQALRRHVVPMTIAVNPSVWYSMLLTYKKGQFPENAPIVSAVAYEWLKKHAKDIAGVLGGRADVVTIVPSKRGHSYEAQPLRRALATIPAFAKRLSPALRCVRPDLGERMKYVPEIFEPVDPRAVKYKRVLLIEDTWISGATAVSAAGALLRAGAKRVLIVPIAREFTRDYP